MAEITARRASGGPASVEDIYKQAASFEYDPSIPLRFWLRTASTMQKEAQAYDREGNDEQTYRVLLRHALLVFEKLPGHPEAKEIPYKSTLAKAQKAAEADILRLEDIKPRIKKRYAEYQEFSRRRKAQIEALSHQRASKTNIGNLNKEIDNMSLHAKLHRESGVYGSKKVLDPSKDQGLAAQLAHREARRRDAARRAVRQAGVSEEEEQERRTGGLWGNWEKELDRQGNEDDDLSRWIQEVGRRRDEELMHSKQSVEGPLGVISRSATYHYPTVPPKSSYVSWESNDKKPIPPKKEPLARDDIQTPNIPPQLPPKPQAMRTEIRAAEVPPPVPGKFRDPDAFEPTRRKSSETSPVPELDSSDYNFPPHAFLENGTPLRTMFLPPDLRSRFLAIAAENTKRNIETCGILCGTLISNALFVQKLVIPEQEGTSDTCETVNEAALFDYIDKEDLMTFGWIHTHPTQTCFMSSRDLHTHSGYQVMLPESIAIVCAPSKDPSWGVFRLTDPPGLKTILNCSQSGLFHPHGEIDTYTDALRPGHVCEIGALEFDVVDLRPGKG